MKDLRWNDVSNDRFEIEPEETIVDREVIAGILVGCAKDGQEAGVWVTEEQAHALVAWLQQRIQEVVDAEARLPMTRHFAGPPQRVLELAAEVDRLRESLERIAQDGHIGDWSTFARDALSEKGA